jgi:hypothetical protein
MRHDNGDKERRRCGLCSKILRPSDSISVTDVGERCFRCFNQELADRIGVDFDNTPIAPIVVADVDGVRHRFEIRSMLVADDRLESQASHQAAPTVPAAAARPGASKRKAATRRRPTRSWPPSPRRLEALIEEATMDAYGESEQATAFLTVLEEHLALPFAATVLGEVVVVEKIDLSGADELIAMCRRRGKRQKVRLVDLELPVPRPKGAEWVAAYHRWSRQR